MIGNELKPHIGIFGRRNYGKSSLINYLTGQPIAIVADLAGTTTDPVRKSMEIGGIGPVVWIDTAGIDDVGDVGRLRTDKSLETLPQCDQVIILFSGNRFDTEERELVERCRKGNIPYLLVYSKNDIVPADPALIAALEREYDARVFLFTDRDASLREPLIARIRETLPDSAYHHASLLGDVIHAGDTVLMVTPIDSSAPEGRMILPQVQVLRDILDNHATAVVCRETELEATLRRCAPQLVITDSQVYGMVSKIVPEEIPLTSFSVVLARAKGLFDEYLQGTPTIDRLRDGDRVLLMESCTHNVTCEDIGRVKLPNLLRRYTGKAIECETLGGAAMPSRPWSDYALVIQCGGCVVTARQLAARLAPALEAGVPVSNYGLAIAFMTGIFQRSTKIFKN